MLDPIIRDLAQGKNFATLAFHLPDGQIASHVMWIDADDTHILINTEVHRLKYNSLVKCPGATVTIWDSANPYRYAEVRGNFVEEVRGDAARAHIDACSQRYMGVAYQGDIESERVIMKIEPLRQRSMGLD
jgi:hypothetical protein